MASPSEDVNTKKSGLLDFPQHLRAFVQRMRDDESSHDVVFVVGNDRFPAHRCLMAAASPVLRKMLTNGMKETNEREVVLKEVNVKEWKAVLDYIYTAKIELANAVEALQFLACAERFQIEELEGAISEYIVKELDTPNCSEILAGVDCLNSTKVRAAAMKTIVDNFYQVFYEDGFTLLPFELVLEIFRCEKLVVRSELDAFVAAARWFMSRITCEVSEEPKDGTSKGGNEALARKVLALFVEYEFVNQGLTESRPLLFGTKGFVESDSEEDFEFSELFDCVEINKLSIGDLQRAGRLCRVLCKESETNYDIELAPVQKFGEKVVEKLLELDNNIPNILVPLCKRIPHRSKDLMFLFSHRFQKVQDLFNSTGYHDSPRFTHQFTKGEWFLRVYFRGHNYEIQDKYVSCFLYRTTGYSDTEEHTTFDKQIFMDLGNSKDKSNREVHTQSTLLDNTQRYGNGSGRGSSTFAPSSSLSGKDKVTIGVLFYFKSDDND